MRSLRVVSEQRLLHPLLQRRAGSGRPRAALARRRWLNPPWQKGEKGRWLKRLKEQGNGIALIRGGTDSRVLHDLRPDALFLLRKRVPYLRPGGESERPRKGGAVGGFEPSVLLAVGDRAVEVLAACTLEGMFLVPGYRSQPALDFAPRKEPA